MSCTICSVILNYRSILRTFCGKFFVKTCKKSSPSKRYVRLKPPSRYIVMAIAAPSSIVQHHPLDNFQLSQAVRKKMLSLCCRVHWCRFIHFSKPLVLSLGGIIVLRGLPSFGPRGKGQKFHRFDCTFIILLFDISSRDGCWPRHVVLPRGLELYFLED